MRTTKEYRAKILGAAQKSNDPNIGQVIDFLVDMDEMESKLQWQSGMLKEAQAIIESYMNGRTDDGYDAPRWIANLKGPQ